MISVYIPYLLLVSQLWQVARGPAILHTVLKQESAGGPHGHLKLCSSPQLLPRQIVTSVCVFELEIFFPTSLQHYSTW